MPVPSWSRGGRCTSIITSISQAGRRDKGSKGFLQVDPLLLFWGAFLLYLLGQNAASSARCRGGREVRNSSFPASAVEKAKEEEYQIQSVHVTPLPKRVKVHPGQGASLCPRSPGSVSQQLWRERLSFRTPAQNASRSSGRKGFRLKGQYQTASRGDRQPWWGTAVILNLPQEEGS